MLEGPNFLDASFRAQQGRPNSRTIGNDGLHNSKVKKEESFFVKTPIMTKTVVDREKSALCAETLGDYMASPFKSAVKSQAKKHRLLRWGDDVTINDQEEVISIKKPR